MTLNDKKTYIIGASGVIGSELYKQIKSQTNHLIGTCNSNNIENSFIHLDIRKKEIEFFTQNITRNDTVFLLSAYSNPTWIFANREEAIKLNLTGTKNFIDQLIPQMPHLIFMSSVEVFDGEKGNYSETDEPKPLNLYGRLKFEIERYLQEKYIRSTIVRTGWNVGMDRNSRCVVRLTYDSLQRVGAKMAKDNIFSIISAKDTALGLLSLIGRDDIKCIHFAADDAISRTELANIIMEKSEKRINMEYRICKFSDIEYSEPRGKITNLSNNYSKIKLGLQYEKMVDVLINKIRILDQ